MKDVGTLSPSSAALPWKYRLLEPHAVFVILSVTLKLWVPSLLKWLAYDTISTSIISIWYPLCATISLIHRESQPSNVTTTLQNDKNSAAAQDRKFWIEYWTVGYSLAQCIQASVNMMPFFLTWSLQYSYLPIAMAEMKFLFFVWIFVMEPLLKLYHQMFLVALNDDQTKKTNSVKRFLPLTILKRLLRPRLVQVQSWISEPISKEHWQRFIHSKAHRILNLLVALQFLTEEWSDYLLQLLDECRSLLLLSPFLVLPSTLTKIGVLYAQFVLPSARSLMARGKIIEVLYLQYWVLNIFLSTAVYFGSWLWWFVPFSTQITFAVWCYLTFPRTITEYYAVVEQELITFGILSGESQLKVTETKTVQALRAVVKRIPSANDAEGFRFGDDDVTSRYGPRSQRKLVPRSQSAPATLLAISAIKTLHDSAVLSPRQETDDEEDENDEPVPTVRPHALSTLSKSLPAKEDTNDRSIEPPLFEKNSPNHQKTNVPSSVSVVVESDESSQMSTVALVNIDLRSDHKQIYEEVEVTMKELSAARLKAAKYQSRSPAHNNSSSKPTPYHSPTRNSIMQAMSDEQNVGSEFTSVGLPPTLSTRSVSDTCTPRSNTSGGFDCDLSEVDTAASSKGLGFAESFDVADVLHDKSRRAQRQVTSPAASASSRTKGTPEDLEKITRRRSERIRYIQEQRKLNQLTESLLFMRSTSTDESEDGGKSADSSFVSETSFSTGNLAVSSVARDETMTNRMGPRRQRSSDSSGRNTASNGIDEVAQNNNDVVRRRLQQSIDSDNRYKSALPRYVQIDSSDGLRERRTRRSRSRDNLTLHPTDSDRIAQ
ncbi:hypothetical protein IV203_019465 [Nitzschia inconspicua]|uniref:Uncharacterized protein n=1 Tax=Nitzschia inconspicua TaxID=303405 RepID=A0A9K3LYP1_9STRA|nr:hypothetical protein IV203_019465 [Nitzschia inconspicua]